MYFLAEHGGCNQALDLQAAARSPGCGLSGNLADISGLPIDYRYYG
jgi:hypothetical protein